MEPQNKKSNQMNEYNGIKSGRRSQIQQVTSDFKSMTSRIAQLTSRVENLAQASPQRKVKRTESHLNQKITNKIVFMDSSKDNNPSHIIDVPVPKPQEKEHKERALVVNWVSKMFDKTIQHSIQGMYNQKSAQPHNFSLSFTQNFMRNIIRFSFEHKISYQNLQILDQVFEQQLIPYQKAKYSQKRLADILKHLPQQIPSRKSQHNYNINITSTKQIKFQYQRNGSYNTEIMKLLNELAQNQTTNNNNNNNNNSNNNNNNQGSKFTNSRNLLQNFIHEIKNILVKLFPEMEDTVFDHKIGKNYKYNDQLAWQICCRMPLEFKKFSQYHIQCGNIQIHNLKLTNLLRDWCWRLQYRFSRQFISTLHRNLRMMDGTEGKLNQFQIKVLAFMLMSEKAELDKQSKSIKQNCFQLESLFFNESRRQGSKINDIQKQTYKFCSQMLMIEQAYVLKQLNSYIHHLNKVQADFQRFQRVYGQKKEQLQLLDDEFKDQSLMEDMYQKVDELIQQLDNDQLALQWVPQLVDFSDQCLFNITIFVKQLEATYIVKQLQKFSAQNQKQLKIQQISFEKTNQISVRTIYRQAVRIQMILIITVEAKQLAKIEVQNLLERLSKSKLGPIAEICNIWSGYQNRSDFAHQMQQKSKRNFTNKEQSNKQQILLACKNKPILKAKFPFKCALCIHLYFHCSAGEYYVKLSEAKIYVCFYCFFHSVSTQQKLKLLPNLDFNGSISLNQVQFLDKLPKNAGVIYNLRTIQRKPRLFKSYFYQFQYYLVDCSNYDSKESPAKIIAKFADKNLIPKQFLRQNIIYTSQQIQKIAKSIKYNPNNIKQAIAKYNLQNKQANEVSNKQQKNNPAKEIENNPPYSHKNQVQLTNQTLKKINQSQVSKKSLQQKQLSCNLNSNQLTKQQIEFLKSITSLFINSNNFSQLPLKLSKLQNLSSLHIQHNANLKTIPDFISQFKVLKVLVVRNNKMLETLPSAMAELKSLQKLHLIQNQSMSELPSSLQNLSKLTQLVIQRMHIKQLPEWIGQLKSLQLLRIMENQHLKSLPTSLGNLKALSLIIIQGNPSLDSLPTLSQPLSFLKTLIIKFNNSIQGIAQQFLKGSHVKHLAMQSNSNLHQLPSSLGGLTELQTLKFENNIRLIEIPSSIGNLSSLKAMHICERNLMQLPQSITNLKLLSYLCIKFTSLQQLPQSFGQLQQLKTLNVSHNYNLRKIPQSIKNLSNIQNFTLQHNYKITTLPFNLGNLKALKILSLQQNNLSSLPDSFVYLESLQILKIGRNPNIQSLPQNIEYLKSLQTLSISQNFRLQVLPNSFQNLPKLRHIIIDFWQFKSFQKQIFKLANISLLKIHFNECDSYQEIEQVAKICQVRKVKFQFQQH